VTVGEVPAAWCCDELALVLDAEFAIRWRGMGLAVGYHQLVDVRPTPTPWGLYATA
jgi:hypothetical protein